MLVFSVYATEFADYDEIWHCPLSHVKFVPDHRRGGGYASLQT